MPDPKQLMGLTIRLEPEGKKVIACFTPQEGAGAITLEMFKQAVEAVGFGGYDFNKLAVDDCVAKYCFGEAFEIEIGAALDGQFTIDYDDDEINAYLTCKPPKGGVPVTMVRILDEAKRRNIVVRLNLAAIKDAVLNYHENVLFASGKAPVDGIDGRFQSLIPEMKERSPYISDKGLTNFRELGGILTVGAGDSLLRCVPATPGEPGIDLFGRLIPAKAGKNTSFSSKREGSVLHPNDPTLLVAAIHGCPILKKDTVTVEPLFVVDTVDMGSGNVNFEGSVHVKGDVHPGMTIQATGDIHVDGMVERATLIAGGEIEVKGGVLGQSERDEKFHAVIRCQGSFNAQFVQNAVIFAGNGIFIQEVAMQSELVARHQVLVGGKRGKGQLAGGTARASILVQARVLGASSHAKTVLTVGPDKASYVRLAELVVARQAAEAKRVDVLKVLDLAAASPERFKPETLRAVEAQRDYLNAEIAAHSEDEVALQRELDLCENAQVVAELQFLEGVEVRCGLQIHRIAEDRAGGSFQLRGGDFSFKEPLNNLAQKRM